MLYHGRIIAAVPGWNNSVCRITLLHRHTHSITSINVKVNYYSLFGRNDCGKLQRQICQLLMTLLFLGGFAKSVQSLIFWKWWEWIWMAPHMIKSALFVPEYLHNFVPSVKREFSVSTPAVCTFVNVLSCRSHLISYQEFPLR